MKSPILHFLLSASLALVANVAPAADAKPPVKAAPAAKVSVKKPTDGAIELTNLEEDEEAESGDKTKEAKDAKDERPRQRAEAAGEERDVPAQHRAAEPGESQAAAQERMERGRDAAERGGDFGSFAGRSQEAGAAAYAPVQSELPAPGAMQEAALQPTLPTSQAPRGLDLPDVATPAIMPNPRAGTDAAVPYDASSAGGQETYRERMVQQAAAAATGNATAVGNPAAVRRYLATDRAAYQRRLGY